MINGQSVRVSKKAKEPMAVVPKALYKFEDVSNLLAFSPLRRPRMNLEEEGDKDGAEGEVLEEGLDDFGDIDY